MNYLICFLLAMVVNISALAASNNCADGVQKIIDGKVYAKKLEPDEQVFGFYSCARCGERTSAKPDTREVKTHCQFCNAPHTTEIFDPPSFFRVTDAANNTDVYIVDAQALVKAGSTEDQASRSGVKVQCPHCGGSHFTLLTGCPDCGASLMKAPKATPGVKTSTAATVTAFKSRNGQQPELVKKVLVTKKRALSAGAGSVLGTAAIIYWTANYNYQTTGTVVRIDEAQHQVTVAYVDYYGEAQRVLLDYDSQKTSPWYLTEEITLYFIRWPANQGAERMNGEVFPFELPKRATN